MPDPWRNHPSTGTQVITIDKPSAEALREYVQTFAPKAAELCETMANERPSAERCWDQLMTLIFWVTRMLGFGDALATFPQRVAERCSVNLPQEGGAEHQVRITFEHSYLDGLKSGIQSASYLIVQEPEFGKIDVGFVRRCRRELVQLAGWTARLFDMTETVELLVGDDGQQMRKNLMYLIL